MDQPFVVGRVRTPAGVVPRISPLLLAGDRWGSFKARWGVGRMHYTVDLGLYALGEVGPESPVFVTANYKMSFDCLRESLAGRNGWILVVDTQGINVWCAAGKGTFSTDEIVRRIEIARLADVVTHRKLIVPQLAAPGVAAHEVKRLSGFRVVYGPIRSKDLGYFLDAGLKATPEMRQKTFPIGERVVLIPVELVEALKTALIIIPVLFVVGGLGGPGSFWDKALDHGLLGVSALLLSIVAGAVVTPILLPWLPGRAFALKGLLPGVIAAALIAVARNGAWVDLSGKLETVAWLLLVPALTTYLSMNFTGASTYTSLSGVKKEMRVAVPLQVIAASAGILLWLGSRLAA
ncbi:MAG: acetyl-CoA synthase subunit gamma [Desulfomonile tiedjei]|nr:acetyl-CoA synthase subunit gamma [Desulfomonile tiedjei]